MKVATYRSEVVAHTWVNARYKYLRLRCPAPLGRETVAGQFYQLLCPVNDVDKPFLGRPMSVYAIGPEEDRIGFLYHVKGVGTRALERLRAGDELPMIGPLGRGFSFDPRWRRVLLVARGVGLATMAPLVPLAARSGVSITMLLSARSTGDLMRAEFEQGARAEVHAVFDSDGSSAVGHVEVLLKKILDQQPVDMVYTCGSNRLLMLLQKTLATSNLRGEVALEQQMACAMGVCLSCVRLFEEGGEKVFRRVCCEGPVFPIATVSGEVQFG